MIYISNLHTKTMVISLPGWTPPSNNLHEDTRVTYFDDVGDSWTESFDVSGDVALEDLMTQTRGSRGAKATA